MTESSLDARTCIRLFVATLLAVGISFWSFTCSVRAEQTDEDFSPAENWVLEQVKAGKVADLEERFPDEKDRGLSADFMQKLLTGKLKDAPIHRHGVRIEHAKFTDPLDLVNAEVLYETWLHYCRFEDEVSLRGSHFHRVLSFRHSEFTEGANFVGMTVGGTASFEEAIFEGAANFSYAQIGGNFQASEVQFTHPEKEAYFHRVTVGDAAFFNKAVFTGAVDFGYAQIGGDFQANDVRFTNPEKQAYFHRMTVGDTAFFNEAFFAGTADFSHAQITSGFQANGAKFTNLEKQAYFHRMTVGDTVFFNEAFFAGTADFSHAQITSNFQANDAKFTNPEKKANFGAMKVGGDALFEKAVFEGAADFDSAQINGSFKANEAEFTNGEEKTNFAHMKVGGAALFNGVVFAEPVDFRYADIAANFEASGAKFEEEAHFGNMKLGYNAIITNTRFIGPADFRYAQIGGGFQANETQFNNAEEGANFQRMTVGGKAFLGIGEKAIFKGPVNLIGAQFLDLEIQVRHKWPTDPESIRLDGMTYQHISAKDETWRELLNWVDGSAYSTQPYVQLEAFFRAEGYPERADEVFVARKRRERKEALGGPGSLAWWANLFLEWFVFYGVRPQYALLWGSVPVLFGCLWFRRENMEPQKAEEDAPQPYCPFWYSLDLFLPINLQMANAWRPRQDRRFARHYARVHTILGWILIPIGLAAVTGIIK